MLWDGFDVFMIEFAGKSTLLNHLFGTNFREMDAFRGTRVLFFFCIRRMVAFSWMIALCFLIG